jgi:hypothetical protein
MSIARKSLVILGSATLAATAFMLRGMVPELVRYLKIRKM